MYGQGIYGQPIPVRGLGHQQQCIAKNAEKLKTMNPIPPVLLKWLQETLNRFFIKRPEYFKYWGVISNFLMLLSGLPYLIQGVAWVFGFEVPGIVDIMANKLAFGIGIGLKMMTMLTVKSPAVAQTEEGSAVKVTDEKKFPFTSQAEKKDVDETVPPPPVVTDVPEKPPPEPEKKE